MQSKFTSRFTVTMLLTLAACLSLNAQAQAPSAPTVTFTLADGTTIHKSAGSTIVTVTASDTAGLRSLSLSGGYAAASSYYSAKITSASLSVTFFGSYFPTGDYTFTSSAVNNNSGTTTKSITLHLVP